MRKNRGPRQRSKQSLINLLNRRNLSEGHQVELLIFPINGNWATGVKCSCGKYHPVGRGKEGFIVRWEKEAYEADLTVKEEKPASYGYVTGFEAISESWGN